MTPHGAQGRAGENAGLVVCGAMTHPHSSFLVCAQSANTLAPSAHRKPLLTAVADAAAALVIREKCPWIFSRQQKEGNKKCSVEALCGKVKIRESRVQRFVCELTKQREMTFCH
jgi:hypothetical protein